jgi:hypothetical protein
MAVRRWAGVSFDLTTRAAFSDAGIVFTFVMLDSTARLAPT